MTSALHHQVVVVGGGTAGITVAARLRRAGIDDVAVIEPSTVHHYQPLWTLVGGGRAPASAATRRESSVMPRGVRWIQDAAAEIDPDEKRVLTASGVAVEYDQLVVCPGIQLDFDQIPGVTETLGANGLSSNYRVDLAPRTWDFIRTLDSGTAVFTMPTGAIKCGGAPQKIAYLAADQWRHRGVLDRIRVVLVLPGPKLFGVPVFNAVLEQVVERYGIEVRLSTEMVSVDSDTRTIQVRDEAGTTESIGYDFAHVVPPMSAPDWVKASPLAVDDAKGWIDVDKHTLQSPRWPDVFALGDAAGTPNSKTGAAVRKQAPVVVANLLAVRNGHPVEASYDGYSSCPIVTARNRMLLAEFDYTGEPHPTIPMIDTVRERYDMWLLKRYGLPALYWNLMLKGLA